MIAKSLLILRLTVTLILAYVSNDGDGYPLEVQEGGGGGNTELNWV